MKKLLTLMVIISTCLLQFGFSSSSYADPGSSDLRIQVGVGYLGAVLGGHVCNDGDETVEQFTLSIDSVSNYTVTSLLVNADPNSSNTDAQDPGSIDSNTGIWTGLLQSTQCVAIIFYGDVTGGIGDELETTISVSGSLLEGGTNNIDPNSSNDSSTMTPYVITALPDVAIQTRLLTEGVITSGSNVSYEVFYHNLGDGMIPQNDEMTSVISFIVPDAASFGTIVDLDPNDNLSSDPGMCFDYGSPSNMGAGLIGIEGTLIICLLSRSGNIDGHTSYPFQYNMVATDAFASGSLKVYAMASGPDIDTQAMQRVLFVGGNPFEQLSNVNNIATLTYDNSGLTPSINLCPGQTALSDDGSGCFRISFNKKIWAPSFTQDDLILTSGSIDNFTKVDDFTWDVNVSGILLGQSAALTMKDASVLDYSAVLSGVQVLGENVIRYEIPSANASVPDVTNSTTGSPIGTVNSAKGTLANTGLETDWPTGIVLILVGMGLFVASKKRYSFQTIK